MSLAHAPIALLERLLGRRQVPPDDPLQRHLSELLGRMQPDALFRRRLRGEAVNRFVAMREVAIARSQARSRRRRREMGRLGRAVLYASMAIALGVTAVGAASQGALPGDPLHGVKLRLEEIRMQIAPASVRPQLAAAALEERLAELERLAAREEWGRVSTAVAMVERASVELAAFGLGPATPGDGEVLRHATVLNQLAERAPAPARDGLETAIEASSAATAGTLNTEERGQSGEHSAGPPEQPGSHAPGPPSTRPGQRRAAN